MQRQTKKNRRPESPATQVLRLARAQGALRPRDLAAEGIAPVYIQRLAARGQLVRVGRGLYTLPNASVTEHHSLAEAAKRLPRAVVCLLSALRFHGLTTQAPFEVWLAIDPKARSPRTQTPPLRIVRMSGERLRAGVERHRVEGVDVQVFSRAKTVADCFRFRNKIGLDVALEALREYLRDKGRLDAVLRFAEIDRVARVIRPYAEAMA